VVTSETGVGKRAAPCSLRSTIQRRTLEEGLLTFAKGSLRKATAGKIGTPLAAKMGKR